MCSDRLLRRRNSPDSYIPGSFRCDRASVALMVVQACS